MIFATYLLRKQLDPLLVFNRTKGIGGNKGESHYGGSEKEDLGERMLHCPRRDIAL